MIKFLAMMMFILNPALQANIKETLFAAPTLISAKISPDTKTIAYVGADSQGIPNVFIFPREASRETAEQITFFTTPGIIQFFWSGDSKRVLLTKDEDGKGKLHLHGIHIHSKHHVDYMEQFDNVSTKVLQISSTQNRVAVGLNDRDPLFHDLYRLDLDSGQFELLFENHKFAKFLVSDSLDLILKMEINTDGSWTVFSADDAVWIKLTAADAFQTEFLSYHAEENSVYLLDSRFTNMSQLLSKKISGEEKIIASPSESDIDDLLFIGGKPRAYATYYLQKKWHPIDTSIQPDLTYLENQIGPNFEVINTTSDGSFWIVANSIPDQGGNFWLYDTNQKSLSALQYSKTKKLAKMYPMVAESRDGKKLVCYYTLPKEFDKGGTVDKPIPLVVIPHGGPFKARDRYQFNPFHQWLANCGYAVLSVNFRLSSGFGKEFVNAGNGEWGKKAHLDVLDAVDSCIAKGITEKGKLAILGGSYGGYEALASLTFSPDYYACGVAICGPSNLRTVLEKSPLFWEFTIKPLSDKMAFYTKQAFLTSMLGESLDPENFENRSPLNYIDSIQAPLLLVHGKNDHVVNERESHQIYSSMKKNGKEVTYILFPDEGHRIARFANLMKYMDQAEHFLSEHLGGKYQPVSPTILEKSSAQVFGESN
ncbi:MAG: S9 family peptidase [Verrucomicrobia bacterium]|nr:S9 family peptidase [Verrucomicrobiota bacterium]